MTQLYRYTVYLDDNSKLSGYSQEVFIGVSALLDDGVLNIRYDARTHYHINWSRVRWYMCEPIGEEVTP